MVERVGRGNERGAIEEGKGDPRIKKEGEGEKVD
jgi:hypothetical protein